MHSMSARQYADVAPLDEAPSGPWTTPEQRHEALSDALRGVELGSWDGQIRDFLIRAMPDSTLRTIVSLFERVRDAGMVELLDMESAMRLRQAQRTQHPQPPHRHQGRGVAPMPQHHAPDGRGGYYRA